MNCRVVLGRSVCCVFAFRMLKGDMISSKAKRTSPKPEEKTYNRVGLGVAIY